MLEDGRACQVTSRVATGVLSLLHDGQDFSDVIDLDGLSGTGVLRSVRRSFAGIFGPKTAPACRQNRN